MGADSTSRTDESEDDWKWTLRSSVKPSILRWNDTGDGRL